EEAGDRRLVAHILADLSGNAAAGGRLGDAVAVGESAVRLADKPGPTRLFAMSQLAYAFAHQGEIGRVQRICDELTDLAGSLPTPTEPAWVHRLAMGVVGPASGRSLML